MTIPPTDQTRINTYISTATARLITDHAEEWGCTKGEAVDRLIGMALGIESAQRHAAEGLDVMEEMVRRVLGDFTLQPIHRRRCRCRRGCIVGVGAGAAGRAGVCACCPNSARRRASSSAISCRCFRRRTRRSCHSHPHQNAPIVLPSSTATSGDSERRSPKAP